MTSGQIEQYYMLCWSRVFCSLPHPKCVLYYLSFGSSSFVNEPLLTVILSLNAAFWMLSERDSLTHPEKDVMTTTWFALCTVYSVWL
jgi:hypothetical protein